MKKYAYWIFLALVVGLGIYFVAISARQRSSVPIIKFTVVERPENFGEIIYQNLREQIKNSPVVFLGVTPHQVEDLELWRGFLAANQEPGSKYDLVIMQDDLPFSDILNPPVKLNVKDERLRLSEGIIKARAQNLRVAVITPNIYSSQLLTQNPASLLMNQDKIAVTSLSVSKFPVTMEQEEAFEPKCSIDADDRVGVGPFACVIRNKARNLYRKKTEAGKYSGIMDQTGDHDYTVLFNRN